MCFKTGVSSLERHEEFPQYQDKPVKRVFENKKKTWTATNDTTDPNTTIQIAYSNLLINAPYIQDPHACAVYLNLTEHSNERYKPSFFGGINLARLRSFS